MVVGRGRERCCGSVRGENGVELFSPGQCAHLSPSCTNATYLPCHFDYARFFLNGLMCSKLYLPFTRHYLSKEILCVDQVESVVSTSFIVYGCSGGGQMFTIKVRESSACCSLATASNKARVIRKTLLLNFGILPGWEVV